jgi:pyridoxamine 5'-phosphate oxidase family protein
VTVCTESEIAYLNGQPLGRLAPAGVDGKPHAVAVAFSYNADPGNTGSVAR